MHKQSLSFGASPPPPASSPPASSPPPRPQSAEQELLVLLDANALNLGAVVPLVRRLEDERDVATRERDSLGVALGRANAQIAELSQELTVTRQACSGAKAKLARAHASFAVAMTKDDERVAALAQVVRLQEAAREDRKQQHATLQRMRSEASSVRDKVHREESRRRAGEVVLKMARSQIRPLQLKTLKMMTVANRSEDKARRARKALGARDSQIAALKEVAITARQRHTHEVKRRESAQQDETKLMGELFDERERREEAEAQCAALERQVAILAENIARNRKGRPQPAAR